jgi:hypothetical protein
VHALASAGAISISCDYSRETAHSLCTSSAMPTDIFTPSSQLVLRLLNAPEFRRKQIAEGHQTKNQADELMEDPEHLSRLLNDLFWASLQVEEGRTVSGVVCICSPEESPRSRRLFEPVRISPKALVTLFTASPANPVAVHLHEGRPYAWGFLDSFPVFAVRIRIVANGTLIASEDSDVVGILEKGEETVTKSLHKTGLMLLIANCLGNGPFPDRMRLAARIQAIAVSVHRHGHGGALVITPPSEAGASINDIDIAFRFDHAGTESIRSSLNEATEAQMKHEQAGTNAESNPNGQSAAFVSLLQSSAEAHGQLLGRLLSNIGDLSRIDGAVVLDTDLRIHGFGAKLSGIQDAIVVSVLDALTNSLTSVPISDLGGMRHQSAARYIHNNHDSLVIVASQDGRVTLFGWVLDPGEVIAIRRLEHYAWDETSAP